MKLGPSLLSGAGVWQERGAGDGSDGFGVLVTGVGGMWRRCSQFLTVG
ncbi:hypothetical protein KCP73_22995 [Salmonella enterica subsp. enterica]|nr:hypothetical protein KCP73_22995 [Salmonella enterica subsp. enterica]